MKISGKFIAFVLLGVAYVAASAVVFRHTWQEVKPRRVTLRIAHWQIEGTVRNAMDAMIKRYEELHPDVEVIQITIPDQYYLPWIVSQMVGESGPDLAEYSWPWPDIDRFFRPIDDVVGKPNPYNKGTPLEGVPWRDTFIDGMTNPDSLVIRLNHYYAAPLTTHIPRVVYNRTLMKTITGREEAPKTYREFFTLCTQVQAYAKSHNLNLVPLANARDSCLTLIDAILGSLPMHLQQRLDYTQRLKIDDPQIGLAYLRGEWSYASPEVMAALQSVKEFGAVSTPGFLQRERYSSMIDFVAQRSLMIVVPSWDASSLKVVCPFEINAFRFPFAREDDPVYGHFTQGPFSEGQVIAGMGFNVNRLTEHRAEAIDFLHFITSQEGSRIFTNVSNWQPATLGVEPSEFASRFKQVTEGNTYGSGFSGGALSDTRKFFIRELERIWNPSGGVEAYREAMDAGIGLRIRDDLRRNTREAVQNTCRADVMATAAVFRAPPDQRPAKLTLATVLNEDKIYQTQDVLANGKEAGK